MIEPKTRTPFDSIESAQEFLGLLLEVVLDAKQTTEADLLEDSKPEESRRKDAMGLVMYKLEKLEKHLSSSHRLLNDLRTLRRLLLDERAQPGHGPK